MNDAENPRPDQPDIPETLPPEDPASQGALSVPPPVPHQEPGFFRRLFMSRQKQQSLAVQNGYLEMVDLIRAIRCHLDRQETVQTSLLGMLQKVPETMDRQHEVLTLFKKQLDNNLDNDRRLSDSMGHLSGTLEAMNDAQKTSASTITDLIGRTRESEQLLREVMHRAERRMTWMIAFFVVLVIATGLYVTHWQNRWVRGISPAPPPPAPVLAEPPAPEPEMAPALLPPAPEEIPAAIAAEPEEEAVVEEEAAVEEPVPEPAPTPEADPDAAAETVPPAPLPAADEQANPDISSALEETPPPPETVDSPAESVEPVAKPETDPPALSKKSNRAKIVLSEDPNVATIILPKADEDPPPARPKAKRKPREEKKAKPSPESPAEEAVVSSPTPDVQPDIEAQPPETDAPPAEGKEAEKSGAIDPLQSVIGMAVSDAFGPMGSPAPLRP